MRLALRGVETGRIPGVVCAIRILISLSGDWFADCWFGSRVVFLIGWANGKRSWGLRFWQIEVHLLSFRLGYLL